uniref:Tegument protein UL51 homolog n=1 Tax=Human betaherpesvirus 6 TaxID=10368 RepID=A0A1W6D8P3_9BETA|nr:U44 [Human betaherpesvirus 6]
MPLGYWGVMGNCFRRLSLFGQSTQANYEMLCSSDDLESEELTYFLDMTYKDFGVYQNDIISHQKDTETMKTLLGLLPMYKKTKLRHTIMERCLSNCPNHVKDALCVELMKAEKILQTMDVVFMKTLIGEFSMCTDNLNQLLNKFATDQSTLSDVEKINSLIEIDGENSKRLLVELDPILHEETGLYQALPNVVTEAPSEKVKSIHVESEGESVWSSVTEGGIMKQEKGTGV